MQTEDEIGARQDYQDSLRAELREKLQDDETIILEGGRYIDFSTVLDNINTDYYKYAVRFLLAKPGSTLMSLSETIMDSMKEKALDFTVNFYIAAYADQQVKEAQNDY